MVRKLKLQELGRPSVQQFRAIEKHPVILVLDNIRSGHNVGAAFRIADAFAVKAVYLCGITAKPPHREILKTSLGSSESVDWKYFTGISEAVKLLRNEGFAIVPVEQTDCSYSLIQYPFEEEKIALVFGNEVEGISQELLDSCSFSLEIPQFGTKHSLNVATSIGIVLWEYLRKRQKPGFR